MPHERRSEIYFKFVRDVLEKRADILSGPLRLPESGAPVDASLPSS